MSPTPNQGPTITNPYLSSLIARHADMAAGIKDLQLRASEENRDLTETELESIQNRSAAATKMYNEIQLLTEQENRAAQVDAMSNTLREARKASATAKDRDPGHYRKVEEGGQYSFFSDMWQARSDSNGAAATRLREHEAHMRAETTATVPGVVPPKWITELYTTVGQQDAALWGAIAKYPLADARPFSLPGQTGLTTVANQPTGENGALVDGDGYNAAAATITPATIVGRETVSRHLLDASNPTIDQLILDDLQRSYVAERELRIGVAIRAVASTVAVNPADFIDPTGAEFAYDVIVDAGIYVRRNLFMRPTFLGVDYDAFAMLLKLKDADGRPLVIDTNQVNGVGQASLTSDGMFAKLPLVVSEGMNPAADAADHGLAVVHGPSVVGFESPGMTFRYEEVSGPESIRLGLWKYFAVAVRQGTRAVRNILVDDDESPLA